MASQADINALNPDELYSLESESWRSLYDGDNPIEALSGMVNKFVLLPFPKLQSTLAALYMMSSSKWSRVLPILLCYGSKGTGKSTIATLAAKLHDTVLCSANDTFSSIRNNLNKRFLDNEQTIERDGVLLAWDNIYIRSFELDPRIYQLFLYGYSRDSDIVSIANRDGTNISFRTFCPKIASSVEAIHLHPNFSELRRRLLILNHKKSESLSEKEREGLIFLDANQLEDMADYSWLEFDQVYNGFWMSENNIKLYVSNRRRVSKMQNRPIDKEKWVISVDLITVGLSLEYFDTPREGAEFMAEVFKLQDKYLSGDTSATYEHLKEFVNAETEQLQELAKLMAKHGEEIPLIIPAKKVKDYVMAVNNDGGLDTKSDTATINSIMLQLGWKLTTRGWMKQ